MKFDRHCLPAPLKDEVVRENAPSRAGDDDAQKAVAGFSGVDSTDTGSDWELLSTTWLLWYNSSKMDSDVAACSMVNTI